MYLYVYKNHNHECIHVLIYFFFTFIGVKAAETSMQSVYTTLFYVKARQGNQIHIHD